MKGQTTASDYVAPRELPMSATPRPSEGADAKVVLDVPDAPKAATDAAPQAAEVAEVRQRRRAPTLKIDRSAVRELKQIDDGFVVQDAVSQRGAASGAGAASSVPTGLSAASARGLARPSEERRSSGATGWVLAAASVVLIGGGAVAVGAGLVPGLNTEAAGTVSPSSRPAATPTTSAAPAPAASAAPADVPSAAPTPEASGDVALGAPTGSGEPVASAPSASPSTPPSAPSAPVPGASSPWAPRPGAGVPTYPPRPPSGPPPGGYGRPRPKSDIPSGI